MSIYDDLIKGNIMNSDSADKFSSYKGNDAAASDKRIIELLKSKYDFNNPDDVIKCYRDIQNVHFSSELGRKFDDYIFDLKNSVKNADINKNNGIVPKSGKGNVSSGGSGKDKVNKRDTLKNSDKKISYTDDSILNQEAIKELNRRNKLRNMIIFLLLALAGCSIFFFGIYYKDAYEAQKEAQRFAELKSSEVSQFITVEQELKKDYDTTVVIPEILDEYKALYNKNKSLIGWIKIDDTKIDYPVMQTINNDYYLKHNFDQKEDANGCIFLDTDCDIILGCTNYIVYGHHMNSGKMFGSLVKYGSYDFYKNHDTIYFDTIYEKGTYKIMYVFRSHIYNEDEIAFKYYQFIQANSEAEFNSAMDSMAEMSLYETGVYPHYGDQLLTLSTCDYQEANGRFVVVAKKVD